MSLPASRILALLELLQSRGQLDGAAIAAELQVERRTVRRYIVALEALGIPVDRERGRFGGYRLATGFRLPPLMFSEDEALALGLGLLAARQLGLADTAPAVASAQAKLERVLPAALKQRQRGIAERVALDLQPAVPANPAALSTLGAAALAQQRVAMRYRDMQGRLSERPFDPYGLGYRGGRWYAVGHCGLRRALRSFRLDRIESVDPLPQAISSLEQQEDGVLLRCQADELPWMALSFAALPFPFRILEPDALAREIASHARQLLTLAGQASAPD